MPDALCDRFILSGLWIAPRITQPLARKYCDCNDPKPFNGCFDPDHGSDVYESILGLLEVGPMDSDGRVNRLWNPQEPAILAFCAFSAQVKVCQMLRPGQSTKRNSPRTTPHNQA